MVFKVKPTTKFEKILNAFCNKKSVAYEAVRFVFDGTRVNPQSSPEDLGMDDGDTIDAFLEVSSSSNERHTAVLVGRARGKKAGAAARALGSGGGSRGRWDGWWGRGSSEAVGAALA